MTSPEAGARNFGAWVQRALPKLVLSPTVAITLIFVYGFILWTAYLSFTKSKGYPVHEWVGWMQYDRVWHHPRWAVAMRERTSAASLVPRRKPSSARGPVAA